MRAPAAPRCRAFGAALHSVTPHPLAIPGVDLRDQLQHALGTAYRIERELGQGGMESDVWVADIGAR